jgi:hypothetical protein
MLLLILRHVVAIAVLPFTVAVLIPIWLTRRNGIALVVGSGAAQGGSPSPCRKTSSVPDPTRLRFVKSEGRYWNHGIAVNPDRGYRSAAHYRTTHALLLTIYD